MSSFKRSLFDFLIPGGFIFAAAFGFFRIHGLPLWVEGPIQAFPLIVLAFGLFFGWYLSSGRLILSLILLALADRAVILSSPADSDPESIGAIFFSSAAILVPLNLMAASLVKEHAIASWSGIVRLVLVLLQPFAVFWLARPGQAGMAYVLQQPLTPIVTIGWTAIPQLALLIYLGALVLISTRFIVGRNLLDSGTLWALIASFVALQGGQYGWSPTSFFATAGLILFVTFVQASHRQLYCDDLTGIPGKLAYDEAVAGLGKRYVLAVVGIDQLKQYGNQHGKSVSDQVLRLLAQKIMASAGAGRVYRPTGEEVVILFSRKAATATLVDLGAVRKAVEEATLYLNSRDRVWEGRGALRKKSGDEQLPVTVSIGLAAAEDAKSSFDLVIKAAYRALYEAKGEGGNRVKRGTVSEDIRKSRSAPTGQVVAYSDFQN
ncbi:MAG: GGDEF domain-containing protein [Nitrospira sp.]|nr:GGDEF domain-containing protein [Nitrospira sp.]